MPAPFLFLGGLFMFMRKLLVMLVVLFFLCLVAVPVTHAQTLYVLEVDFAGDVPAGIRYLTNTEGDLHYNPTADIGDYSSPDAQSPLEYGNGFRVGDGRFTYFEIPLPEGSVLEEVEFKIWDLGDGGGVYVHNSPFVMAEPNVELDHHDETYGGYSTPETIIWSPSPSVEGVDYLFFYFLPAAWFDHDYDVVLYDMVITYTCCSGGGIGVPDGELVYPLLPDDRYDDEWIFDYGFNDDLEPVSQIFAGRALGLPVLSPMIGFVRSVSFDRGEVIVTDGETDATSEWKLIIQGLKSFNVRVGDEIEAGCIVGYLGLEVPSFNMAQLGYPSDVEGNLLIYLENDVGDGFESYNMALLDWIDGEMSEECRTSTCVSDGVWVATNVGDGSEVLLDGSDGSVTVGLDGYNQAYQTVVLSEPAPLEVLLVYQRGEIALRLDNGAWFSSVQPYEDDPTQYVTIIPTLPAGTYKIWVDYSPTVDYPSGGVEILDFCASVAGSSRRCTDRPWYSSTGTLAIFDGFALAFSEDAFHPEALGEGTWTVDFGFRPRPNEYDPTGYDDGSLGWSLASSAGIFDSGTVDTTTASEGLRPADDLYHHRLTFDVDVGGDDITLKLTGAEADKRILVSALVCYWLTSDDGSIGDDPGDGEYRYCIEPVGGDNVLSEWIPWHACRLENALILVRREIASQGELFWVRLRLFFTWSARHTVRYKLQLEKLNRYEPFGTIAETKAVMAALEAERRLAYTENPDALVSAAGDVDIVERLEDMEPLSFNIAEDLAVGDCGAYCDVAEHPDFPLDAFPAWLGDLREPLAIVFQYLKVSGALAVMKLLDTVAFVMSIFLSAMAALIVAGRR